MHTCVNTGVSYPVQVVWSYSTICRVEILKGFNLVFFVVCYVQSTEMI